MGGARNRRAGHNFERECAEAMRKIGFNCITSRAGDRSMDNQGVDLLGTKPFNIQCKNLGKCVNYPEVFKEMPKDTNWNVIFSKVQRKGEYAIIELDDFLDIISKLKADGICG